jgi:hypothetical protein
MTDPKVEIGGLWFEASLGQKLLSPCLKEHVCWYISVIPATWEVELGGSWFKAGPGKSERLDLENIESKKVWGCGPSGRNTCLARQSP